MSRIAAFRPMKFARITVFASLGALSFACAATEGAGFGSGGGATGDAEAVTSPDAGSGDGQSDLSDAVGDGDGTRPETPADARGLAPGSIDAAKMLAGSYAGITKFRKLITVGASLGTFNALASVYSTIEITANSAQMGVGLTASQCHIDITGTGTGALQGATLEIPDVVMTTTHLDPVTLSASNDGGAAVWALTELHAPIGWKWSSPSDMTPTSASDPRVFDQDMDGNPGVTMHVLWNGTDTPMYFVQTERDILSGSLMANGDLSGTTIDSGDQNIIGNTSALGGATVTWAADPNTADNAARIVPVPAPLTCAQLMAQASSLFP